MRRTLGIIVARALGILVASILLAGCGGSSRHSPCPGKHDFMGCAAGVSPHAVTHPKLGGKLGVTYPGPKFPDVSSYQGHPNWAAAKGSIEGVIAKAGEYSEDPTFAYNVAALKHLGIPVGGYWFVRNTGCAHEGAQIVAVIRSVGGVTGPVVLDMEVGEARGYAYCLAQIVHAGLGVWPAIYTAPGTWPGGSTYGLRLWLAAYGPSSPPSLNGLAPAAWQAWSPPYTYYSIPGLGYGDVSVDLHGFFAQAKPKPVLPVCVRHRLSRADCARTKAQVERDGKAASASARAYKARGCVVLAGRDRYFTTQLRKHPRTRTAYRRGALAATRRAESQRSCGVYAHRVSYFSHAAAVIQATR